MLSLFGYFVHNGARRQGNGICISSEENLIELRFEFPLNQSKKEVI